MPRRDRLRRCGFAARTVVYGIAFTVSAVATIFRCVDVTIVRPVLATEDVAVIDSAPQENRRFSFLDERDGRILKERSTLDVLKCVGNSVHLPRQYERMASQVTNCVLSEIRLLPFKHELSRTLTYRVQGRSLTCVGEYYLHCKRFINYEFASLDSIYANPSPLFQTQRRAGRLNTAFARFRYTRSFSASALGGIRCSSILICRVQHRFGGVSAGLRLLCHQAQSYFSVDLLAQRIISGVLHLPIHQLKLPINDNRAQDTNNHQNPVERCLQRVKQWETEYLYVAVITTLLLGAALMISWFFWLTLWGSERINSSGWWGVLWFLVAVVLVAHGAQILVNAL